MIKKSLFPVLMIFCGVIAGALIISAIYTFTGFSIFGSSQKKTVSSGANNADMTMLAYQVLEYVKDEDYLALSHVVHPEFGVVLSPYATINLATDRRFSVEEVAEFGTDTSVYVWGVYNGRGEPIELTTAEYFEIFVPAAEFLEAKTIGINQVVRSGNALENITEVFPNVQFIDFHISSGDTADEPDWSSLRLGFEEYRGYFRLVTIVYSTWA